MGLKQGSVDGSLRSGLANLQPLAVLSIGTTNVPDRDGYYCCCAVRSNGTIQYGIKTSVNFPLGTILRRSPWGEWLPEGVFDPFPPNPEKFVDLPVWEVIRGPALDRLSVDAFGAGSILHSEVKWYQGRSNLSLPRSPACRLGAIEALWKDELDFGRVTQVVRLGIDLRRCRKGLDWYYQYGTPTTEGNFTCKYNGFDPPPIWLNSGSIVAVFLSDHAHNTPRAVLSAKHGPSPALEQYWYLKIGSVLFEACPPTATHVYAAVTEARQRGTSLKIRYRSAKNNLARDVEVRPLKFDRLPDGRPVLVAENASTGEANCYPVAGILHVWEESST